MNMMILFPHSRDVQAFDRWFRAAAPNPDCFAMGSLAWEMEYYERNRGPRLGILVLRGTEWRHSAEWRWTTEASAIHDEWERYSRRDERGIDPGRIYDCTNNSYAISSRVRDAFGLIDNGANWDGGDGPPTLSVEGQNDMYEFRCRVRRGDPGVYFDWARYDSHRLFTGSNPSPSLPKADSNGLRYTSTKPPFKSHRRIKALALP